MRRERNNGSIMLDVVGFTIKEAIKILQEHKKSYIISHPYPTKGACL